jgi:hypothetical protein
MQRMQSGELLNLTKRSNEWVLIEGCISQASALNSLGASTSVTDCRRFLDSFAIVMAPRSCSCRTGASKVPW